MSKVRIGIIGSRFQAECIAGAVKATPDEAELVAVASPTQGHAASFAQRHGIARSYTDYRELLRDPEVEMISITAPNRLHAPITIDAARAGKHVVCEKPLCLTLEEADAMIDACRTAGVLLLYAEELFFAPKYVKAKQLADEGAFGRVHLVKQGEKHSGPHSDWFWDVAQSGGGAVMDLGCHGIAFCWWFLGKPKIRSVYSHMATQVHRARTQGDDEAVTIIEFENGAVGMVESSWNRPGGMDDCIEVFGDKGQTYADLLMGNALPTYSEQGFGYAVEKAATTKGWVHRARQAPHQIVRPTVLLDPASQHHQHVASAARPIHHRGVVIHHLADPAGLVRHSRPRRQADGDPLVELLRLQDPEHLPARRRARCAVLGDRGEQHAQVAGGGRDVEPRAVRLPVLH